MATPSDIKGEILANADQLYDLGVTAGKQEQGAVDGPVIFSLQEEITTLTNERDGYKADLALRKSELDEAKRRIAELESDEEPPPVVELPYVGSSMKGNGDPKSLEDAAGRPLGLRRTYWNLGQIDSAVATAKADIAKGRRPWISFKLRSGQSWADALTGRADADVKALVAKLAALSGIVWLSIGGHEPEGDGVMSDWVKVQQRFWPMIQAPNIVPWIILTGGDTFTIAQYSLDNLYPAGTKYNIALDGYNRYGDADHIGKGWSEMREKFYDKVAPEAKKRGVDWAIAETGYTDSAAEKDHDWLTRAFDDMANHPVQPGKGLSYFNSDANSNGTWPLNATKLVKFVGILRRSHA